MAHTFLEVIPTFALGQVSQRAVSRNLETRGVRRTSFVRASHSFEYISTFLWLCLMAFVVGEMFEDSFFARVNV